jgi:hypothetical protein
MMTYHEFRESMETFRRRADVEAAAQKDPQLALDQLHELYAKLDASERGMANRVLVEWCLSTDEGMRFDALAIIDDFRVSDAAPALRELANRLRKSNEPGAPYELQKANRIANSLDGGVLEPGH